MQYISHYQSPLGGILLTAGEAGLTGLLFDRKGHCADYIDPEHIEKETPVLEQTKRWLTLYFSGQEPDFTPPIRLSGSPFQLAVWNILLGIPYGQTVTYGEIAREIAVQRKLPKMSAQAVGGAVGRNKIAVIVPCHRVVGAGGNLTGYAGGIDKKVKLLSIEKNDMKKYYIPKKETAL